MTNKSARIDPKALKIGLILLACYVVFVGVFYWIVKDNWRVQYVETSTVSAQMTLPVSTEEMIISQQITVPMDELESISLWPNKASLSGQGEFTIRILDGNNVLSSQTYRAQDCPGNDEWKLYFSEALAFSKGKTVTVEIIIPQTNEGLPITFSYGNTVDVGKFEVKAQEDMSQLTLNGVPVEGRLFCKLSGYNHWAVMQLFFPIMGLLGIVLLIFVIVLSRKKARRQNSMLIFALSSVHKYSFLISRLVSRDFHVKYKRSVLGYFGAF